MWAGIASFFVSMFSSTKLQDTAIDGLRKVSGLDEMTQREKADYILKYIEASKYQSPIRRLIAFLLTGMYVVVAVTWLLSAGVGYMLPFTPALEFAGAVRIFMADVIVQPFNIILAFYFVTQVASKFGGK